MSKKGITVVQKCKYNCPKNGNTIVQKMDYNCPKKEITIVRKRELQLSENGTTITHAAKLNRIRCQDFDTFTVNNNIYMGRLTEVNCNWLADDEKLPNTKLEKVQIKDMFAKTFT